MTRRRSGFTLIELMIAMTMMAGIMAVVAGLIAVLIRIDRGGREHDLAANRWSILWDRARDDIRGATSAEGDAGGFRLAAPDGSAIAYRFTEGGALRVLRDPQGKEREQSFPLGRGATLGVEIDESAGTVALAHRRPGRGPEWRGAREARGRPSVRARGGGR
jgi:prepilin-type N-terminal cleavage/methylation domain-containing protein